MITCRRLLKSWTMPPVNCPTASIFWDCRSASSLRFSCSVCSRTCFSSVAQVDQRFLDLLAFRYCARRGLQTRVAAG
jgi:hypothetical protein